MTFAIRVEGLGKKYGINRDARRQTSMREELARGINWLIGRKRGAEPTLVPEPDEAQGAGPPREFWALRDLAFEVGEGERVGIIGANGAGKSTLLKILSRVTAPTEGRVELRGKVASLLEVGTGFHPELTGRENIYLNGAILGMSRVEIRRKFDQIVDFSGVAKFIDTPVKHYSSGMYVRLAFSVSAWLDPDILILDEVLAVGDQAFQKKCEERMRELTKEGRTVLFVSHSMATVNQMCQKALYLDHGQMVSYGPVVEMTREYNRDVVKQIETDEIERHEREAAAEAAADASGAVEKIERTPPLSKSWRWHRARFSLPSPGVDVMTDHPGAVECLGGEAASPTGEVTERIPIERETRVTVRYRIERDLERPVVATFNVYDELGTILFVALPETTMPGEAGEYRVTCVLPPFLLNAGRFTINANLSDFHADRTLYFGIVGAIRVEIEDESDGDPRRHGFLAPLPGYFRPRLAITGKGFDQALPSPSGSDEPVAQAEPQSSDPPFLEPHR